MSGCFVVLLSLSLASQAAAAAKTSVSLSPTAKPFSESWLSAKAQALSETDYHPPEPTASALTEAQYQRIRFRPDAAVWRNEGRGFELQMFARGYLYSAPIRIHLVQQKRRHEIAFDPSLFERDGEPVELPPGFAGFRVHYPINRIDYSDEVAVFLGASYFRVLGRDNSYGLSARGLAIDTATPQGETFPQFTEFYVETPEPNARQLVIHALLDSPAATGAYRFVVQPGATTEVTVSAKLFARRGIQRFGIAPLTSMYLFGENDRGPFEDIRPEVHDSDGLSLWTASGEQLWRPLSNPPSLSVSTFRADGLKGFGLMQRDRVFSNYQDLDAAFERRPSVWVEPITGFTKGRIFLIEIPSSEEIHDNVVAFFAPDERPKANTVVEVGYRMFWGMRPGPQDGRVGSAHSSLIGAAPRGSVLSRRFAIDFSTAETALEPSGVEAVITSATGTVSSTRIQLNPAVHGYRASFDLALPDDAPTEMRCFLRRGRSALTETWSYLYRPARGEK